MQPTATQLTPDNLRVHVIHYTRLKERRMHMEQALRDHGLDRFPVAWVTVHDREDVLANGAYDRGDWGDPQSIAAGSISLILKHLAVYREVAAEPDAWHLILEDDVLIRPGFVSALEACLTELPARWDLFYVGLGCSLHVPWWLRRTGRRTYWRGWKPGLLWGGGGCSRCTEAYLIHPNCAERVLASHFAKPPFDRPIDWLLNAAGAALQIHSYWAEPPLVTQGAFESWMKDPHLNPAAKNHA
ncbi:glycosyltransferase family 25 protein [Prosthecobacter vanneervenii]|uniref:GR25 family glycosyltransferase involved in LPS biosynthesis n=1 Tax=Prosthecobacter vanneervenii TaxID=48466 RepID=A0A7W7Y7C9_9BACT|nr:glycosyltransferase family 25 protein [Prosthecobacter vanneervenii]MBB5030976.1 GR25 family glycosyltransferase involved in LPS biosynthesis [Prosthecobacter vanneervenii]